MLSKFAYNFVARWIYAASCFFFVDIIPNIKHIYAKFLFINMRKIKKSFKTMAEK